MITLILTDDQALDIVSQISNKLRQKKVENADSIHSDGLLRCQQFIESLASGSAISVKGLAQTLDVPTETISTALVSLKQRKVVEMVMRGTWKKL